MRSVTDIKFKNELTKFCHTIITLHVEIRFIIIHIQEGCPINQNITEISIWQSAISKWQKAAR